MNNKEIENKNAQQGKHWTDGMGLEKPLQEEKCCESCSGDAHYACYAVKCPCHQPKEKGLI